MTHAGEHARGLTRRHDHATPQPSGSPARPSRRRRRRRPGPRRTRSRRSPRSTRTRSTRRRRTSSTRPASRPAAHILCNLAFSDPDIVDEPSGIVCGSTELLFSQQRSVIGKRFYDGDGNLTRRHFRELFDGTFTNPDTGKVATWTQHDTIVDDLTVPGDLSTGITHLSGLFTRVTGPNGGTVLNDAGMFLIDAGSGESLHQSANHPFDDYFANGDTAALAPLCNALD